MSVYFLAVAGEAEHHGPVQRIRAGGQLRGAPGRGGMRSMLTSCRWRFQLRWLLLTGQSWHLG